MNTTVDLKYHIPLLNIIEKHSDWEGVKEEISKSEFLNVKENDNLAVVFSNENSSESNLCLRTKSIIIDKKI